MNPIERAKLLAQDIRESDEYTLYAQQKEEVDSDAGIKSLLKEYERLQMRMQFYAASGQQADTDETQRFSGLTALLYNDPRTSAYLLTKLRLQKLTADVLQIIGEAADIGTEFPG